MPPFLPYFHYNCDCTHIFHKVHFDDAYPHLTPRGPPTDEIDEPVGLVGAGHFTNRTGRWVATCAIIHRIRR